MRKDNSNDYRFWIVFTGTIIPLFVMALYIGFQKEGYHMDELYSYGLANSTQFSFPGENNNWVGVDYFYDFLNVNRGERFHYQSVIQNQINDVHPPLYYMVIHTVSSFFPDLFSKWIGIGVNIFFYLGTVGLISLTVRKILENKWIGLITGVFWGVSIGALSSIVFIRMYTMLTFFCMLFFYFLVGVFKNESLTWKKLGLIIGTIILGTLTQYFFLIYAFFVVATACIILFIQKEWKKSLLIGCTSLIGVILSFLIFPSALSHMLEGDRGTEATENIQLLNWDSSFFQMINRDLFTGRFFLIVIGLLLFCVLTVLLKRKNTGLFTKRKEPLDSAIFIILAFVPSISYVLLVQQIAPYQSERYILNVYPSIIILLTMLIYITAREIPSFNNWKASLLSAVIAAVIVILGILTQPINFLYEGHEEIKEELRSYEDTDTLVISSAFWRTNSNIQLYLELGAIYRMHSNDGTFPTLPEEERLYSSNELLLFLDQDFSEDSDLERILEEYGFEEAEYLFSSEQSKIYYLD